MHLKVRDWIIISIVIQNEIKFSLSVFHALFLKDHDSDPNSAY